MELKRLYSNAKGNRLTNQVPFLCGLSLSYEFDFSSLAGRIGTPENGYLLVNKPGVKPEMEPPFPKPKATGEGHGPTSQ
jgi:hypothetical protein